MLYAIVGVGVLVVVLVLAMVFLGGGAGGGGGGKLPPVGPVTAEVSLRHDSAAKQIATVGLPREHFGRFVVYYLDDMLFYYGNGSKAHDQSGPLRHALRAVLADPAAAEWSYTATVASGAEQVGGTLYENGYSGGRVLGWRTQDECRRGGLPALLAEALRGPDAARVRGAVEKLLGWQEERGPNGRMGDSSRATEAWSQT
jgi:hypothetical protein